MDTLENDPGILLACEEFGRRLDRSYPACVCVFFFFLKWRLARAHQFYSLGQDQSTVAQQAETIVVDCSLSSCMCARFVIGSYALPGQQHRQPSPTSLGQGCVQV